VLVIMVTAGKVSHCIPLICWLCYHNGQAYSLIIIALPTQAYSLLLAETSSLTTVHNSRVTVTEALESTGRCGSDYSLGFNTHWFMHSRPKVMWEASCNGSQIFYQRGYLRTPHPMRSLAFMRGMGGSAQCLLACWCCSSFTSDSTRHQQPEEPCEKRHSFASELACMLGAATSSQHRMHAL
jgi:hypothetical protein